MKFGKLLNQTSEDMPEMNNLFLRYKKLKKQLKHIEKPADTMEAPLLEYVDSVPEVSADGNNNQQLSPIELEFVRTLNEDLSKFNQFFMDKEEESVIKLQALIDAIQQAPNEDDQQQLKAELVNFHGEMVLLLHWSLLNYAAVVKILKKHDKRTGLLLRAPYLSNVLQQPFYSTNLMSRLVKQAEEHIHQLVGVAPAVIETPSLPPVVPMPEAPPADRSLVPGMDPGIGCDWRVLKQTQAALEMWDTLSKNASTPSTVLPLERFVGPAHNLEVLHQQLCTSGGHKETSAGSSDEDSDAEQRPPPAKRRKAAEPSSGEESLSEVADSRLDAHCTAETAHA